MNKDLQKVFGIPVHYQDYRLKDFKKVAEKVTSIKNISEVLKQFIDVDYQDGKYLYFWGKDTTCKTAFATAILNTWIIRHKKYSYFVTPDVLIKAKYPDDNDIYPIIEFNRLADAPFIVLDDLYNDSYISEKSKNFAANIIDEFLQYRKNNNLGGVITSKFNLIGDNSINNNFSRRVASTILRNSSGSFEFKVDIND